MLPKIFYRNILSIYILLYSNIRYITLININTNIIFSREKSSEYIKKYIYNSLLFSYAVRYFISIPFEFVIFVLLVYLLFNRSSSMHEINFIYQINIRILFI